MKRVFAHESLAYVGHLKNVLEQSGIACVIRNAQLSGALGEIPFLECLPELWVLEDSELERATRVIEDLQKPLDDAPAWVCRTCNEPNEGQFIVCWQCGESAPQPD